MVSWPVNDDPSEPLTRKLNVNVSLLLRSLRLKLPQAVAWPLYVVPDAPTAATDPVSVKVAQTWSPAGKKVMCSTALPLNSTPGTDGVPGVISGSPVHGLALSSGSTNVPC